MRRRMRSAVQTDRRTPGLLQGLLRQAQTAAPRQQPKVLRIVEYNVVTYCRLCKKRMVTKRSEQQGRYCDKCYEKVKKSYEAQEE